MLHDCLFFFEAQHAKTLAQVASLPSAKESELRHNSPIRPKIHHFNLCDFDLEPSPQPRPDGHRLGGATIEDAFSPVVKGGKL